ncbi:MAG: ribosomal rRNA E-loop binding protein Ctc/L25/TL5 [Phenylobacterium sp.]|jgi:large subunit ribosomal protein L25|uniref:50S ribosomal protein L25/general stress protein Ctc n=1 Tax=Phenylobacterium sp. TaxID=1871053 RepID=UPI00263360C3|nr:50S ribosomal protein L25/general stress protein Ctc [Phenylobacterium sp.]MDB5461872.1 ribosomal rRNA E-loop binding protein Ctc/L25/TL5 [Phenylobacterium sp.]MDB5497032.1 ribosomal rRNA E-loop binding protein Ctc/L25/TL5 [Phenylobacterium sp.]
MAEIVLNVEVRERTGTGGARVARRSGLVPGVLYGGDQDPVAISVKVNEFRKALYTGKLLGHLVTLKYGKETQPVIAKAVDMHPVTDQPWHFDLYRVSAHQQIKIEVPVHFVNQEEAPGIKRGGTLNVVLHSLTVSCAADEIPEDIVVDLTGLDIGATIRVSDLKVPGKAEAAIDADTVVATIAGAMAEVVEEEPTVAEGEEEAAEATEAEAPSEGGGEE